MLGILSQFLIHVEKKPWYTYGVTVNVLVKFLLYENWISSMAALLCIGASKKTTKKLSENAPVLKATWSQVTFSLFSGSQ